MAKGRFVKKVVKKTTNNITTGIVNQIKFDGGSASRINTTGVWDEKRQIFRRSGARKGYSDISACIKGRFVVIEVKNDDTEDELNADQIEFLSEVAVAGGITFVAQNIEQFNEWYFNELPNLL